MNEETVGKIVEKFKSRKGGLISILEEIQSKCGYLPKKALEAVSQKTGKSLVDIYGVATFYKSFSLKPRGKHLISVCLGTACHVHNAPGVAEEFENLLLIKSGETTKDGKFTLETVNCLGACALGPIVMVDGHYFSHVKKTKVRGIIKQVKEGFDYTGRDSNGTVFPVNVNCSKCNHSLMDMENKIDGHSAVRVTVAFGKKHGWLRLSSLYGSHSVESEYEIPKDTIVNFFCPFCHAELISSTDCAKCEAPMVPLMVGRGGLIRVCSRKGCGEHMLVLDSNEIDN